MIKTFKAGDLVWLTSVYDKPRKVKVAKVGRKYLYLVGMDGVPFSIDTGYAMDGLNGIEYYNQKVWSIAGYKKRQTSFIVRDELQRLGLSTPLDNPHLLAIYEAVKPILETLPKKSTR